MFKTFAVVVVVALCCLTGALATVTTRSAGTVRSDSTVFVGSEVDKLFLLRKAAKKLEGGESCLDIKPTNIGYVFKRAERGVRFARCDDGRDCWKILDCESPAGDKLCFRAYDCRDLLGANRCLRFARCQCFNGNFRLEASQNGFQFAAENFTSLSGADLKNGLVGIRPVFRVDECFNADTFNFAPCQPGDEDCQYFAQCTGEPGTQDCFRLLPGLFEFPTTVEPTFVSTTAEITTGAPEATTN